MMKFFFSLLFSAFYLATFSQENEFAKKLLDSARSVSFKDIPLTKKIYAQAKKVQPYNTEYYYYILMDELGFYADLGELDIALIKADTLINQENYNYYKGIGYKEKGIIASKKNEVAKTIEILKKAISIFEEEKDPIEVSTCLKILGNTLFVNENIKEARAYYKRSAKLSIEAGDSIATGLTYNNLSRTYAASNIYDSAIYYNNKIFNLLNANLKQYKGELTFMAYLNEADYQGQNNNFTKSKIAADSALKIAQELKVPPMLGAVYQINCANFAREGKYEESLIECEKGLDLFKSTNQTNYYLQTLTLTYESAAGTGDFKKAYTYLKEYQTANDSIKILDADKNLKDLRLKYETTEKELKITEQQAEITQKENQRKTLLIVAIALGLLTLLGFLFFRQRQKNQKQKIITLENEKENIALRSLMAGEEKERSRIAKELHDGLGGILAAAKMYASKNKENSKVIELLDTASKESRRISHNLLPESLLKKGLDQALQDFIISINESGLLKADYQSVNLSHNLPKSLQLSVYRIVQELLNNIIKHSGATEALVQLQQEQQKLIITVEDNGKGFANNSVNKGIGLQNIESRLSLLKGKLQIDSQDKKGTSVYIELELEK